jgi:hypothetical protein
MGDVTPARERDVDEAIGEFLDLADDMLCLENEAGYVLADYLDEDRAKRLRTLGIALAAMGETWLRDE